MAPASIPLVKPGQRPVWSQVLAMYEYDRAEPFAVEWLPNRDYYLGDVKLRGLAFQSGGSTSLGWLALPEGEGPFPAVVYAPGTGDMGVVADWKDVVVPLLEKGYAALLLDEGSDKIWRFDPQLAIRGWVDYAIQERRGVDYLETLPQIDAERVGFAGFSSGAILGGLLGGVEPRFKALALNGCNAAYAAEKQSQLPAGMTMAEYRAQMTLTDPTYYLTHNKQSVFFFTYGQDSDVAPIPLRKQVIAEVKPRATVYMHKGSHYPAADANREITAWFLENL